MSHESGKVEVLAMDEERFYFRYHRAKDPEDAGRFFACRRDDEACWLDDLEPSPGLESVEEGVEVA
jgi:hypothetical protein